MKTKLGKEFMLWETPEVVVYGDIDTHTQMQQKLKQYGSGDDFYTSIATVNGVSNP